MEHGTITSVYYEQGVVTCDVRPVRPRANSQYDKVPVVKQFSGTVQMPEPGQKVVMDSLEDDTRFIIGYLATQQETPQDAQPGEITIQVDSNTKIELSKTGAGDYDVNVSASGSVFIDGIDFSDHTHDVQDSTIADTGDGTGTESTETKTTTPPK